MLVKYAVQILSIYLNFQQMHNGARPSLPHIAIVLTDGKSNSPTRTAQEAARAREQGIHVFAIGIGSEVERSELEAIASEPTEQYVFQVGDYTALQYIREILAIKTCEGRTSLYTYLCVSFPTRSNSLNHSA